MSESDDTDILLLIPPDLFAVASSGSEESLANGCCSTGSQVVSGLLEQVQSLESRFKGLESKEIPFKTPPMPHKVDLLTPDTFNSSKLFKSPPSAIKKFHSKPHNHSSPLRYVPTTTSSNDPREKRHPDMFPKYYTRSSTTSELSNLHLTDPFSPTNFKSNNSYDTNSLLPALDLKTEAKDLNFPRQNTTRTDPLGTSEFSQLLNNSSGNSLLDRMTDRKSPKKDQFAKTIRDISKIHENYSKLSTPSEANTVNSRNYNFPINSEYNRSLSDDKRAEVGVNTDSTDFKTQRLLSLTDFWEPDSSKSEVEKLRIKIEEEKFRREHCEKTIQELQKRLLEQQERVAVAIGIDKEKNSIIHQYQSITQKLKNQFQTLQSSQRKLEESSAQSRASHQVEVESLRNEIKQLGEELSTCRSLSQEYRDKVDAGVEEKLQLLATHANELESYKSFVKTSEERYERLKSDYDKLVEKNKAAEEASSVAQQDLYRERLKAGEIRSEMALIHKALDTCEAELTVLRQEKENLQLKLKEEEKRRAILEGKRNNILEELNAARKSEEMRREEAQRLVEQQEQMRGELREIYQNQVDDVVKVKVKEFQAHLDSAEASFKAELEVKQRAIAECAAGKIKTIIDKHRLEINLLEEKHKEEKRLYELRLSQNVKKSNFLEAKLNAQQAAKSRIAEQLHSLMEKQWKQAVQIISSGNDASFGNSDTSREIRSLMKANDFDDAGGMEPVKLGVSANKNFFYSHQEHDESLIAFTNNDESREKIRDSKDDLKKYIKMILQMQESKSFSGTNGENESSVSSSECRQVPRKYYTKADAASTSEKTVTWQQAEPSTVYNAVSMTQVDNKPSKPPWK
ncbi:centrobin [Diachasma alloeum]|uniref:centrobin n=1 Tax=Diachasma alloeum TaxID=454923 RepID=UPI0007383945|nr:centrobin [Diachasma alloeum]